MTTSGAVSILEPLVAFDTVPTATDVPAVEFCADLLGDAGWRVRIHRDQALGADKAMVLASIGPPEPDGLMLSGHLDIVPWADQPGWSGDPLTLRRLGDRLIGRGTADMKGFVACCLDVARRVDESTLHRPVVLLLTCDEEVGCLGAGRIAPHLEPLAAPCPLPSECVIGEPTSFRVLNAHKGHVQLALRITGRGGHSSRPDLGTSAISAAAAAVHAVDEMAEDLVERIPPEDVRLFPEHPGVPFNLGTIHGGSAVNMIADQCELTLGFRPTPAYDAEELLADLEERIERAVRASTPGASVERLAVTVTPSMRSPADGRLGLTLADLLGRSARAAGAPFATDGGQLARAGVRALICGPGELDQAHRPDESIAEADLQRCSELIESLIARLCG